MGGDHRFRNAAIAQFFSFLCGGFNLSQILLSLFQVAKRNTSRFENL
jgi:hypothetical protein